MVALDTWIRTRGERSHIMEWIGEEEIIKQHTQVHFMSFLLYLVFANLVDCVSPRQDLTT